MKKYRSILEISQEQITTISYFILSYGIKSYIASHQKEYNEFLAKEKTNYN